MAAIYESYIVDGTYIDAYTPPTEVENGEYNNPFALSAGMELPIKYKLLNLLQDLKIYEEIVVHAGSDIVANEELL